MENTHCTSKPADFQVSRHNANGSLRLPLLHFVTADLPSSTRSPELDDSNTIQILKDGRGTTAGQIEGFVDESLVGLYLAYLVAIGFMPAPSSKGARQLPVIELDDGQKAALNGLQGRGAIL